MGKRSRLKKEQKRIDKFRKVYSSELIKVDSSIPGAEQYHMGECTIFLTTEKMENETPILHLRISCTCRYPSWDEIVRARFQLLPERMNVAIFMPAKKEAMDLKNNCFDLWQVKFVKSDNNKKG